MNLVELEAFFPDIEPELPRCPVPVIENRIRDAIIDACERANIWRWQHPEILIVAGQREYDLVTPTADTLIHSVLHVRKNGRPLYDDDYVDQHETPGTFRGYGHAYGHGQGFQVFDRGMLHLKSEPLQSTPPPPVLIDINTVDTTLPDLLGIPANPGQLNNVATQGVYDGVLINNPFIGYFLRLEADQAELDAINVAEGNPLPDNNYSFTVGDIIDVIYPNTDAAGTGQVQFMQFATVTGASAGVQVGLVVDSDGVTPLTYDDPRVDTGLSMRLVMTNRNVNAINWRVLDSNVYVDGATQAEIDAYLAELALYNASVAARQARIDELAAINRSIADYPRLIANREKGLEPYLSIKPSRTTLHVSEVLWRDYYQLIVEGSLAKALMMLNRPWSNPEMGKEMEKKFEYSLAKAKQAVDRGFKTGSQRFRPRRFTV